MQNKEKKVVLITVYQLEAKLLRPDTNVSFNDTMFVYVKSEKIMGITGLYI